MGKSALPWSFTIGGLPNHVSVYVCQGWGTESRKRGKGDEREVSGPETLPVLSGGDKQHGDIQKSIS